MDIQLFRIDDRLIHGQVVIGWASCLNTKKIILCDDSVCDNEWEKELYLSCVPENICSSILSVKDMAAYLKDESNDFRSTIIVVNSPKVVEKLINLGAQIKKVNIGGIHFNDGREKYLSYVYLNDDDIESFKRSMKSGTRFECQDIPSGKKIPVEELIFKKN